MNRIFIFTAFLSIFISCNSTETIETSEYVGVWIAPAPISEGIFYRPNLIVDITPDKMTTYEDIFTPTEFIWEEKKSSIIYKNEDGKNRLNITDNQGDKMKVTLENGDSLQFFRLSLAPKSRRANDSFIKDEDLFDFLQSQTLEVIIPELNWQYRQLICLPKGELIKYESEMIKDTPQFFVGNWQILIIRDHYFLFLHNLKDEKPMLIHLEEFSEYNMKGKIAFNNQLHQVSINAIGSEADLNAIQKDIEGKWKKPNYVFNSDSTFVEIAEKDTLSGNWQLNSTGEILLLEKNNKTVQFGFLKKENSKMDMFYIEEFHNEFTLETIEKQ
ncbi:MAG: hypothetical protein AB8G11_03255 [Saprospiraceae bacterium]